jgi:hypothetical protein
MGKLDEPHSSLGHAACQQALPSEVIREQPVTDSVKLPGCLSLAGQVQDLRQLALHAEREFKRLDHALQPAVVRLLPGGFLVHRLQEV